MGQGLVNLGVNIIGYVKNQTNYLMTCAWLTQVGENKLICLMGSQSESANNLRVGDLVGVSSLTKDLLPLASFIGENHSQEVDKMNSQIIKDGSVLLVKDARCNHICRVIDILHLKEIEDDHLVYLEIIKTSFNNQNPWLTMDDF